MASCRAPARRNLRNFATDTMDQPTASSATVAPPASRAPGARRGVGWTIAGAVWALAMAVALCADAAVAAAVHDHGWDTALHRGGWVVWVWKFPGTFGFTLAVVVAGFLLRWLNSRQAIFVLLCGVAAGLDVFPKWLLGRMRPYKFPGYPTPQPFRFQPFWHGIYGFFHQRDLTFPSGHECSAWALAVAMAVLYPRVSIIFFLIAIAVGVERVLENAHYCSDVVAAMAVASFGCWLAWRIVKPNCNNSTGLALETA